jgi:hypothetical protein
MSADMSAVTQRIARMETLLTTTLEPTGRVAHVEEDVKSLKSDMRDVNKDRWVWHGVTLVLAFFSNNIFNWVKGQH